MVQTSAKTRNCIILGIVLVAAILAVGLNSSQVSADPCAAQLGYPAMAAEQYFGSNILVTVPVTASCYFQTGQLYAVGTAFDATYNSNVGTANTVLSGTYRGNSFSGELQFNLPISVQMHSVQFSVSIYNTQAGFYQPYYGSSPLTTTSATFLVTPTNYQSGYPYNSYGYPSYPGYNHYYSTYPHYYQIPGYYFHFGGYHNNQDCNKGYSSCRSP